MNTPTPSLLAQLKAARAAFTAADRRFHVVADTFAAASARALRDRDEASHTAFAYADAAYEIARQARADALSALQQLRAAVARDSQFWAEIEAL